MGRQAVLVLAYLREGETYAEPACGVPVLDLNGPNSEIARHLAARPIEDADDKNQ